MYAVITAGGRVEGEFAHAIGSGVKALAPFAGATLLDRAIAAAREAGARGVAVVGGEEARARAGARVERWIDAAEDGGQNALRALGAWPGEPILYLTSDLPFVGGEALRGFVERSAGFALTMPLATQAAFAARFPESANRAIDFGAGPVVNGCAFFIDATAVEPLRGWAARFFAARKSKLRMAMLLGPALLLRYATRTLTVAAIECKASRTLSASPRRRLRGDGSHPSALTSTTSTIIATACEDLPKDAR